MTEHELVDSHTNPIIFRTSPGTLETIAASKLALMCWHQQLLNVYLDEENMLSSSWFVQHEFTSGNILSLHDPIQEILDRRIKLLGKELESFLGYYDHCIPSNGSKDVTICLEHLIFQSNGRIAYKSTARNLLDSGKLNSKEQYLLACVFCFEKDIERLWPLVSEEVDIMDFDCTIHTQTLDYWVYRMRNELDKIPGDVQESPEFRLMSSKQVYGWPQIEYFWDKLTPNQQTSHIKFILSNHHNVKYLLPKLNETQLQYALKERTVPRDILFGLAKNEVDFALVLQVWSYMKGTITYDQFLEALDILFKLALVRSEYIFFTDHVAVLLFEIWQSAPKHLKTPILKRNVEYFFDALLEIDEIDDYDMRWYGRDLRFLLDLYTNIESKRRKEIWSRNWRQLIMISKISNLDHFMRLCFDNESDIAQFKEQEMMNYKLLRNHFDKFVEVGFSNELAKYLAFCSSDQEAVRNLKKRIIDSIVPKMHKLKFNALLKFSDFIVNSFPSPNLAYQFKEKLICEHLESWYELLAETRLNGVKNIITCFLASDENLLIEAKRECYERCQHHLRTGTFDHFCIREWQEFFMWCAPSKEDLAQFKKSLPIDDVFNVLLARAIKGQGASYIQAKSWYKSAKEFFEEEFPHFNIRASLIPVKHFLQWYFESNGAMETFMLNTIYNYKQVSAITDMFNEGKFSIIDEILKWLFSHNEVKKQKFVDEIVKIEGFRWELLEDDSESFEDEETSEEGSQTDSASDEVLDEIVEDQIE